MFRKTTILIVDREKILVDLLVRALKSDNLSIVGATSVEQAQQLADLYAPNLVIADPSVSGSLKFLEDLRTRNSSIQSVALAGSEDMRISAHESGIQTILNKSQGLDALVDAIQGLLSSGFPPPPAGDHELRILVTDDEVEIRNVVIEFLKVRNYSVATARNGREAVERVQQDPSIQVVLLDVSMPGMGGIEALGAIMSRNPHPSVIMMTAVADREVARQALKAGAFDYILKPFDFAAIDSSITACLSHLEYGKQPWWRRLTRQ